MKRFLALMCAVAFGAVVAQASEPFPIRVQTGAALSMGTMGFKSDRFPSRTMDALGLRIFPNYDLQHAFPKLPAKLVIGPFFEYRFVGQLTDPVSVMTTNIRGTGYLFGLGLGLELEKYSLIASLDPFGAHYLTNLIPSDQSSTFSSAMGVRLVAGYMIQRDLSLDVNFQYAAYDKNDVVGSLGSDALTQVLFGVGARYFFDF